MASTYFEAMRAHGFSYNTTASVRKLECPRCGFRSPWFMRGRSHAKDAPRRPKAVRRCVARNAIWSSPCNIPRMSTTRYRRGRLPITSPPSSILATETWAWSPSRDDHTRISSSGDEVSIFPLGPAGAQDPALLNPGSSYPGILSSSPENRFCYLM